MQNPHFTLPRRIRVAARALLLCSILASAFAAPGSISVAQAAPAAPAAGSGKPVAPNIPGNIPYSLPVTLPAPVSSPAVDPNAPYTPAVLSLIAQLEPTNPPTLAQVANLAALLHDGASPDCHNVGPVGRPVGLDGSGNATFTTLAAAALVGDTNIRVASVTGFVVGQTIWVDATSDAEQATITVVGTPGAAGTGITFAAPLTKAHLNGHPAYVSLTTPSIPYLCWTDAQGVLNTSGPNARGSTGPMTLMGLGASFDRLLGNVWGQTAGTESRAFMVTGIFGPQTDLDRLPNWGRNLTTTGEDPFLSFEMVATQINGIQGVGAMSQMKHYAVYNGQNQNANTDIQDQALHEIYLTPYEGGFVTGQAAAAMCSYQIWRDISAYLPSNTGVVGYPAGVSSLAGGHVSPYIGSSNPQTWPLNESHFSCEQPMILTYVLHDLWNSVAFIGTDYPATHSTAALFQGTDQEMPTSNGFFAAGNGGTDPTGSTCADATGLWSPLCAAGTTRIGGIPNNFQNSGQTGCPANGCTLIADIASGNVPLSAFNQSLARILYQEERFGMLGCDPTPGPSCTNAGGVGPDRTGTAPLPLGPTSGPPVLGTKNGDAAIVEKMSEEGATLLKNQGNALPLTSSDLAGGILVTGSSANHTVADPTNEASTGFIDRDAINPLLQLQGFTGNPGAFTFVPANDPTGQPVGPTAASPTNPLSTSNVGSPTGNLNRTTGPGSPTTDALLDFTAVSAGGPLAPGNYTWVGYVYVPVTDTYTFDIQQTAVVSNTNVTFGFDGITRTLATAANIYGATTPGSPTNDGYTEPLLTNRQFAAGSLSGGTYHAVTITFNNNLPGAASFRFAFSRTNGDIADAAAAAVGKSKAIVFVNTGIGVTSVISNPYGTSPVNISSPEALSAANVNLINAVAAANPNTIVVLNTDNPVLTPWIGNVKALLNMWFAGQEGGTSTARLLLGLANPGGHSALTWPANATDTIWGYNETVPLYPGEPAGPVPGFPNAHLERLNYSFTAPLPSCVNTVANATICTNETEGIFGGYRFFDKEGITPQFPFGYGLSYTTFGFANETVAYTADGGADVGFDVTNTGAVAGAEVAQVYVGPGPALTGVQQAVRSLRGFQRVDLTSGQTQHLTIHLDKRSFQYWDEVSQSWKTNYGARTIWVGDADALANLPLHATLVTPNAFAHIAPSSPITVSLGSTVTVDLLINSGAYSVIAQQSYLSFTNSLLQNVDPNSGTPSSTVAPDLSTFEQPLQNQVCNGPGSCTFGSLTVPPGSLAYASSTLNPSAPSGDFRVARVTLQATAVGDGLLHWQFSPPAPANRNSKITDAANNVVSNPAFYQDYVIHVVHPTFSGHVTWEGRPAQPSPLQALPISLTLTLAGTPYNFPGLTTDANGNFAVDVTALPNGTYTWRVKGPQYLSTSGSVTLARAPVTTVEMGLQPVGDANNDNLVDISDFGILYASFGRTPPDPLYDARADFNGDQVVDILDFGLLRGNFGRLGNRPAKAPGPAGAAKAVLELRPQGQAPANGGTVHVGDRFVLELWVNAQPGTSVVGQQSYLSFPANALQLGNAAAANPGTGGPSLVTPDSSVLDVTLQNAICNGTGACNFNGLKVPAGSLAFASATLQGNPGTGAFRVGQVTVQATAAGTARLHWQVSPADPRNRNSQLVTATGTAAGAAGPFADYVLTILPAGK